MKFLFDQNISYRILKLLPTECSKSSHIKSKNLIDAPDYKIWIYAKRNNFTIVTKNADFNELCSLLGFPPKVIWIRTGNTKIQEIVGILISYIQEIESFLKSKEYGCFEITHSRLK